MNDDVERLETDILIIGSGGAGLLAAIHAYQSNPNLDITIAVKGLMGKCGCTRMVQGGYNVALGDDDSVERHFMDTIAGGKWLPHQDLAWKLCETAVTRVRELENEIGCFFDREEDGRLHHKAFAGQTADRTVHKGDLTGIEIINRLMEQVLKLPVNKMEEHRALALIPTPDGKAISSVLMVDMRTGRFRLVRAKAVLLATGGGPSMYRYFTPSGEKTMDGLAMALRLGLPLRDMEMVQFHPTGLLAGKDTRMTGTVLEEGLRGAGGYLLNGAGERFMFAHDERGERATRDIVCRGIYDEMRKGNTSPNGGVYISMNHLGVENVRRQFKGMVKRCADCGFDLAADRVEVVPTAHYFMGGLVCDTETRTDLDGLFVAGEDAGGVHGANRLGGNGVANSTVFGGIAGEVMADYVAGIDSWRELDESMLDKEMERALLPFTIEGGSRNVHDIREKLMDIMWQDVGIVRTAGGIQQGIQRLEALKLELLSNGLAVDNRVFNLTWHDWLNLYNLIDISLVIAKAALSRENTRGAHFREDFPQPGSLEGSYFTLARHNGDNLKVTREPVEFTIIKPGESLIEGYTETAPQVKS
jgi:fumarate reductase flavoprotein subunit